MGDNGVERVSAAGRESDATRRNAMTTSLGRPNADLRRGGRRGTHWNFASAFSRWDPPLRFDMPPDATDPDAGPGPSRGAEWAVCATLVHVGVFEKFGHASRVKSPATFAFRSRVPLFPARQGRHAPGGSVAMPPWLCDDIVTCDNFEYMVRSPASALLLLAVPANALFAADIVRAR